METIIQNNPAVRNDRQKITFRFSVSSLMFILFMLLLIMPSRNTYAHCDSYDGPVIKDALEALKTNQVSLVLKWVEPRYEDEIRSLFIKTYQLKTGDKEIYSIVERHFLETLVRLHREGEGAPFTGLKPAGSASPIVQWADRSLDAGNIDELSKAISKHTETVIREKFERVKALANTKEQSPELGREYVKAYIDYTHSIEGIHAFLEKGPGEHHSMHQE